MPSTILHVTITVDPSNAGEFLKHFKPAYEAVIAEPQCNLFRVLTNPEAPGVFIFIEEWTESVEWLMKNQMPKEYYKPYLAATEPLWIKAPRNSDV